ncbi:MAG: hypothetical protein QF712_01555 [Candidatus Marinimicrobia bacterium]|jgi:hypothetical protein|nr:hypothetical protein [Candidatus Neomarinimicrobiota bacterium]MDP6568228.1 hypothetical protein [Candidatus Neomarinimicrobiota bacterium]MDP7059328.1 hypothetical protein [Candidatus Neomarinimicrobiota bacterium]|tara:strand:+ start:868 stop:1284 length:417 start_codon:yes stop_codon:yes gene_type:complete
MLSAIAFAIKMVLAAAFVVLLSLGKGAIVPKDRVGFYALLSVVTAAITAVSQVLNSGMLAGAVFVVIGFISYSQFQKEGDLFNTLQAIAPLWVVTVIGMCSGAGMLLQAGFLTFIAYYLLHYFSLLLGHEKEPEQTET